MLAVGMSSSRPRASPSTTGPAIAVRRPEQLGGARHVALGEQAPDPARGDRARRRARPAARPRSRTRAGRASRAASPARAVAEAEVRADAHRPRARARRRAPRAQKSSADCRESSAVKGSRPARPRRARRSSSIFRSVVVSSCGGSLGPQDLQRVRVERHHGRPTSPRSRARSTAEPITRRWPQVDPVEGAERDRAAGGRGGTSASDL